MSNNIVFLLLQLVEGIQQLIEIVHAVVLQLNAAFLAARDDLAGLQ